MAPGPLFEHNSSMVASTKPTADIMDWALILEAIIYLSHIGCQMDVCLEKKQKQIKKERLLTTKLRTSESCTIQKEVSPEDIEAIGSTVQTKNEGQEEWGIRWLLISICCSERSFKCCNYLRGTRALFSRGCAVDRWLMRRIRSHSFLCLHVCTAPTLWLHR